MPVRVGLQFIEKWKSSMENAVLKYEKETDVPKGQIVFYGASNFTRWAEPRWGHRPLRDEVRGKSGAPCCINRGFGSSCAEHQLYYYPRMVRPLAPKVLVYSPFGNYRAFGYSLEETWELAQRVIAYTLCDFPESKVYVCGALRHKDNNPEKEERARKTDALAKQFCEETPRCVFVSSYDDPLLHGEDLYAEDGLHYNQLGYDRYAEFFRKVLKEELEQF